MRIAVITDEIPEINVGGQVEHGAVDDQAQVGHDAYAVGGRILG